MCSERLVTSVTPEVSGCSGGVTYGVTSRSEHDRYPAYWRELTSSMSSAVSSPVSGQQSAAGFSYRRTSLDGFLRAHNARCISATGQRSKQWMWNKVTDISCYWFVSNSAKRRVNNYTVTASTTEWEFRQIALRLSKLLWKPYSTKRSVLKAVLGVQQWTKLVTVVEYEHWRMHTLQSIAQFLEMLYFLSTDRIARYGLESAMGVAMFNGYWLCLLWPVNQTMQSLSRSIGPQLREDNGILVYFLCMRNRAGPWTLQRYDSHHDDETMWQFVATMW